MGAFQSSAFQNDAFYVGTGLQRSWIEPGLFDLLLADPGVNGLVDGRVYFRLIPKLASLPAVVMRAVPPSSPIVTIESTLGFTEGWFDFDCYAADPLTADDLCTAVRELLQDFSGTLYDGTVVDACFVASEVDLPYEAGGKSYLFRRALRILIFYQEMGP